MAIKTIRPEVFIDARFATPLAGPTQVHARVTATISGLPEIEPRSVEVVVLFTANMTRTDLIQGIRNAAIAALQNEGAGGHTVG